MAIHHLLPHTMPSFNGEHPDFASRQKYDKIYPFVGKPTLSFPKKSVLESMSNFIAIKE